MPPLWRRPCTTTYSKRKWKAAVLNPRINFSSVFSAKSTSERKRIQSFIRVCFIIYSGEDVLFMTKTRIKPLLEKIKGVFSDTKAHPSLITLVRLIGVI